MSATITIPPELRMAMLISATQLIAEAAQSADGDLRLAASGGDQPATDENIAHDAEVIETLRAALAAYDAVLSYRPMPTAVVQEMVSREMNELGDFLDGCYNTSEWAIGRVAMLSAVRDWAVAHDLVDREGAAA